jgi:choline dehydrogenase-like flavoprotein
MQHTPLTIRQSARDVKIASRADVVVVGGGPAGLSAALAAARNGAKVTLLERYNHLGGLASGGMVLVLDDMWDNHLNEISVRGTCQTMIERLAAMKLAMYPRSNEWGLDPASTEALVPLGHLRLPHPFDSRIRSVSQPPSTPTAGSAWRWTWCRRPASNCACIPGSRTRWWRTAA